METEKDRLLEQLLERRRIEREEAEIRRLKQIERENELLGLIPGLKNGS